MDEYDEHQAEDQPAFEPPTERVRIIGAEPAGLLAGEHGGEEPDADAPGDRREERYLGFLQEQQAPPPPPVTSEPQLFDEPAPAAPELPHWADPPTGQVPAVIDRRGEDDDPWSDPGAGPVWREHQHEWDEPTYEPAMLADDDTRVGVLEETPVEERRPWEFDDLTPAPAEQTEGALAADDELAETSSGGESWWESGPGEDAAFEPAEQEPAPADDATSAPSASPEPLAPSPSFEAPRSSGPAHGAPIRPRQRRRPARSAPAPAGPAERNVPVAVGVGLAIAAIGVGCFLAGALATLVLATVIITLAAAEYFAAVRRAGFRPATLLGLVATVAVMVSAYSKGVAAIPLVLALAVVTSMVWYLAGAEHGSPVEGISSTLFGFVWIGLLGSFSALTLAPSIYPHRHGVAFLFGAVVATVAADVGALAVGSWLGRHQLAPHVSPNKTWEGFVGGAVLAVLASAAITGQVHPWTPAKAAVLGLVAAVVAPVGDLCESLVKRELGLKDMGSIIPGHGGVLDRFDGMLFVLPAAYYLVRVLHLG